ncbi:MAG: NAD-dependent epimerase/dehydratase family protein [Candidatus Geothermarchaeales archaeon]
MIKDKSILVTGGLGFIGSEIARALHEENRVIVIDNLSSGRRESIEGLGVEFHEGDIRDPNLKKLFEDVDLVFHEAAHTRVDESILNPVYDADVNVCGTVNMLEGCRKNDVKNFIYASSTAVYGDPVSLPIKESHPLNPKSPYAASKIAGEIFCQTYHRLYGIDTVCLRYFNVYGPRQPPKSNVLSIFIEDIIDGQGIQIFGDGEQTRDFIHVNDVVRASVLAAVSRNAVGKVINVGTGRATSINQLVDLVKVYTGVENVEVEHRSERPGDISHSVADTSLAEEALNFKSEIALGDGVKDCIKWYLKTKK